MTTQECLDSVIERLQTHQFELEQQNNELRETQTLLEHVKQEYFNLYELAPISYCSTNTRGIITRVNEATCLLFGLKKEQLIGKPIYSFFKQSDADKLYILFKQNIKYDVTLNIELPIEKTEPNNNKKIVWTYISLTKRKGVIENEDVFCVVILDLTKNKELEERLFEMAHYDSLTGLPNRSMLYDRLKQDIARAQRQKTIVGILFFDLDGFKNVNDEYGHAIGDKVLKTISNNVHNTLREIDTVARIGGDEFIIALVDLESTESCMVMIERILIAASTPMLIDDNTIQLTASIGVTFYDPMSPVDCDTLIDQADTAMYQAKLLGKNRYFIFNKNFSPKNHNNQLIK